MNNEDIRWLQRFSNYEKALNQLRNAIHLAKKRELSDLEQQGMIQAFEYTHELAWKTLKDLYLLYSLYSLSLFLEKPKQKLEFIPELEA